VHEDAGISGDGHDGWAGAHCHIVESSETFGHVFSTFLVATPGNVLFSCFIEVSLLDDFNVFHLGSHLTHDISHNFLTHCFKGFLGLSSMFHGFLGFGSSDASIKVKVALGCNGAFSHELMSWWSTGESFSICGKAFSICIRITLGTWLNPLGEGFNCFTGLFNDTSLMNCDIVNHLFSSNIEVLSDLLSFFRLGLRFEPLGGFLRGFFGSLHIVLPISGGSEFSVVGIWLINLDSEITSWAVVSPNVREPFTFSSLSCSVFFLPTCFCSFFTSSRIIVFTVTTNSDINTCLTHCWSNAFSEVITDSVAHIPKLILLVSLLLSLFFCWNYPLTSCILMFLRHFCNGLASLVSISLPVLDLLISFSACVVSPDVFVDLRVVGCSSSS
jgi:hypothetical protein